MAKPGLKRLTCQIEEPLPSWSMAPVVAALQAMRGTALVVAVTVVAEVGDFRRFATARELMAYLGLVPSEHSSGTSVRRGGITKAGNAPARRALIEGAWAYRMPARISRQATRPQREAVTDDPRLRLESPTAGVLALSATGRGRQGKGRGHYRNRP